MKHLIVFSLLLIIAQAADVSREGRYGKGWDKDGEHGWDKQYESPSYSVVRRTPEYEERLYPSSLWVCTNRTVDTAADPLWGLEKMNFLDIMKSERFKTQVPASLMFWPLFQYIRGANVKNQTIKMTKGVETAHHQVRQDDRRGDVELQEMCFYLPSKFQEGALQEVGGEARAVVFPAGGAVAVPEPTNKAVYVVEKEGRVVFVRQFPGWAFTAATWLGQRNILQVALEGEEYDDKVYVSTQKSHPWVPEHERVNEVMIPRRGGRVEVKVDLSQQPK